MAADGVDLTLIRAFDALQRVASDPAVQGGEASFSRYVQRLAAGDRSLVGLPIFVMREFRHRNFYVRRDSPLRTIEDLAGRRVAMDGWPHSGNTWSRALMREEGVPLDRVRWVVGRVHAQDAPPPRTPCRPEWSSPGGRSATSCSRASSTSSSGRGPRRASTTRRARSGASSRTIAPPSRPTTAGRGSSRRTTWSCSGATSWTDTRGWCVPSMSAFEAARARTAANRWKLHESSPWLLDDLEAQARLMGPGFEPYGLGAENRRMVARFCEEQHAQGLIPRPIDPAAVFAEFEALAG